MKLQKILARLQKLHPKEIDLSLDRIKNVCTKLGNPQDDIKCIQVCGTNGKGSTISFLHSILKEANIKCNIYSSPHVKSINERFIKKSFVSFLFSIIESPYPCDIHHSPSRKFSGGAVLLALAATRGPANIHLVFLPSKNKKSPVAA